MSKKIPKNISKRQLKPEMGDFVFAKNNLFLYKVVYGSSVSLGMVFLLMLSFFVQGVEKVYADELASVDAGLETEVAQVVDVEPEASVESVADAEPSNDGFEEVSNAETVVPDVSSGDSQSDPELTASESLSVEADPGSELVEEELEESNSTGVVEEPIVSPPSEEGLGGAPATDPDEEASLPETEEGDSPAVENDLPTTPQEDGADSSENNQATSSAEEADSSEEVPLAENVTFEAVSVTQSDSDFSFNKDQCTQLASGSFYCHQPQENVLDDALFSAPDADGDLEIFLVRGGVQTQVTSNTMDDASPYFDQNTNTLVWHRLMDDRYQVISFDIDSETETQLTRTAENNMEPNRQGDYTVWQRWVDGGWNIMLFDGKTEKQITKTTSHNIAPYIHGSLVVWNRYTSSNEKTIEMYDIANGSYVSVDDPDGMSVSNPRMVFVYDSLHPNGDIVTKGYDVLAKKFIDLDTLPRDLPDELPASDSTGETRALIQSKPSLKSEAEESVEGLASTTPTLLPGLATTTESLTLDLTVPVEMVAVIPDVATSTVNFDLVIEPYVELLEPMVETVQE